MREVRFSIGPPVSGPVLNSWAGWPAATGLQPYVVLRATVAGEPDPHTGYLCNIRDIERLLRELTVPLVNRLAADTSTAVTGERLICAVATDLAGLAPPGTHWVGWQLLLTPFLVYETNGGDDTIRVTQSFEFAAAHRLHCPDLSDQRNREIFGKCNNPNGHGHNYVLEVTLSGEPDPDSGVLIPIGRFEQIIKEQAIDRLDHKHLNQDCAEFANLNPSVENITRVIWSLLEGRFAPARLAKVRVWETPKTYAEYEGK